MPTRIRLRGVPHVFTDYSGVIGFLRSSPGYVERQRPYLEQYWSGALRQAGYGRQRAAVVPKVGKVPQYRTSSERAQAELKQYGGFVGASEHEMARRGREQERALRAREAAINRRAPYAQKITEPTSLEQVSRRQEARQAAGIGDINPVVRALARTPGGKDIARGLGQVGQSFVYSPAGVYALATTDPRKSAAALARQMYEDIRHPGRNIGYLGLDAFAVLSAGAGAAARGSAAAGRYGRVAAATRTGPRYIPSTAGGVRRTIRQSPVLSAGAEFLRRPRPKPLSITLPGGADEPLRVPLVPSESPLTRAAQGAVIRQVERQAERKPGGFTGRVIAPTIARKNLEEIARIKEGIRIGPATALGARGAAREPLWKGGQKKFSLSQQFALRMVAEQAAGAGDDPITIGERLAFHEAQGDKRQRKLTELASQYLVDTPTGPRIKPEYPELQSLYDEMLDVAGDRGRLLEELDLLDPARAQGRVSGPGRVIRGARFYTEREARTEARQTRREAAGVQRLAEYQQRRDIRDLQRQAKRAAKTEIQQASAIERLVEGITPAERAAEAGVRSTTFQAGRGVSRRVGLGNRIGVLQRRAQRAEEKLLEAQTDPVSRPAEIARRANALDAVRGELKQAKADLRRAERDVPEIVQGQRVAGIRREAAQTEAASQLQAARVAHESARGTRREIEAEITRTRNFYQHLIEQADSEGERLALQREAEANRLIGGEGFEGGEARIPYQRPRPYQRGGGGFARLGGRGTVISHGPKLPPSLTRYYTGGLQMRGGGRLDTTRLVSESNIEAQRLYTTLEWRRLLRQAVVKPESLDIEDIDLVHYAPMRLDNLKSKPLDPRIRAALDRAAIKQESGERLSREERRALGDSYEEVRSTVFPPTKTAADRAEFQRLLEEGKIGLVPRRLLGELDKPGLNLAKGRGRHLIKGVDAINNAFRLSVLYLKPAYAAPNILGNTALNFVQQGFAAPHNLKRASFLAKEVGPDVAARIDAVMGEGFAQSLAGHEGLGTHEVQAIASLWSKGVDRPFRRASFLYEANRAGYRTPKQLRELFEDAGNEDDLIALSRRANREIIDYSRLGNVEKEVIRRVVLFYPFLKGSTMYGARMLVEHPIKTAALAQVGRQGQEFAERTLGPVPSWEEGAFRAFGGLVDPRAAAILQAPVENIRAAVHLPDLFRGGEPLKREAARLGGMVTPAVGSAIAGLAGVEAGTGRPLRGGVGDAYLRQFPQIGWAQALASPERSEEKLFPESRAGVAKRAFFGGIAPREYRPEVLRQYAGEEERAAMTPVQRAISDGAKNRASFLQTAKRTGMLPADAKNLPPSLSKAINLRTRRYANYAREGVKRGSSTYQQDAFKVDIETLVRWGEMPPEEAKDALAWAKTASKDELESTRASLGRDFFGGEELTAATRSLHENGAPDFTYR